MYDVPMRTRRYEYEDSVVVCTLIGLLPFFLYVYLLICRKRFTILVRCHIVVKRVPASPRCIATAKSNHMMLNNNRSEIEIKIHYRKQIENEKISNIAH